MWREVVPGDEGVPPFARQPTPVSPPSRRSTAHRTATAPGAPQRHNPLRQMAISAQQARHRMQQAEDFAETFGNHGLVPNPYLDVYGPVAPNSGVNDDNDDDTTMQTVD